MLTIERYRFGIHRPSFPLLHYTPKPTGQVWLHFFPFRNLSPNRPQAREFPVWRLQYFAGVGMKTRMEIEAAICSRLARFELEYMGREPKAASRAFDRRSACGPHDASFDGCRRTFGQVASGGRARPIKEVRTHLMETARLILESIIEEVTGVSCAICIATSAQLPVKKS